MARSKDHPECPFCDQYLQIVADEGKMWGCANRMCEVYDTLMSLEMWDKIHRLADRKAGEEPPPPPTLREVLVDALESVESGVNQLTLKGVESLLKAVIDYIDLEPEELPADGGSSAWGIDGDKMSDIELELEKVWCEK